MIKKESSMIIVESFRPVFETVIILCWSGVITVMLQPFFLANKKEDQKKEYVIMQ